MVASIWQAPASSGSVDTPSFGFGRRNLLKNGNFRNWAQNHSVRATGTNNSITPWIDDWELVAVGGGGVILGNRDNPTVSLATEPDAEFCGVVQVTTQDLVLAASSYYAATALIRWSDFNQAKFSTSAAQSLTLSFWTKCTVAGTYSGALVNNEYTRSYIFSYSIAAANTWQKITVTIPGDTVSGWNTSSPFATDAVIARLFFTLGAGSTFSGTDGWQAGVKINKSGADGLMDNLNAQWYITLVQLEFGTEVTPFERRSIIAQTLDDSVYNASVLPPFRNRIINGDMRIDQRNNGSAVTINTAAYTYSVDRWAGYGQAADGVYTLARSTSTPLAGHSYFLRTTVTTADASVGAAQAYALRHRIEGYNVADLAFGSVYAKSVTLSFWVRSSLTGIFSVGLQNGATDRTYPTQFIIHAANTWEYKTLVIPGETTGTWAVDNGIGLSIIFDLGSGSDFEGAINTWSSTDNFRIAGTTRVIGTLNATFDLTAIQLEVGTVATPFERRPYAQELQLCQRYAIRIQDIMNCSGNQWGVKYNTQFIETYLRFPVLMRASPALTKNTITTWATAVPAATQCAAFGAGSGAYLTITGALTVTFAAVGTNGVVFRYSAGTSFSGTNGESTVLFFNAADNLMADAEL